MQTLAELSGDRIEKVLIKDKKENPKQIKHLLKSDLYNLFQNYMEIKSIKLDFRVENGCYEIRVLTIAQRLKNFGTLPE